MPDREYKIRIVTVADNAGSQEAGKQLENLADKTKDGAKNAELFNTHSREMHRLLHMLDETAPGVGIALKAVFDPRNIGLAGFLVAFHELIGLMGEYKKHLQEVAKSQADSISDFNERMADLASDAAVRSSEFASKFKVDFDALAEAQNKAVSSSDEVIKRINLQKDAIDSVMKSQQALELSMAKTDTEREAINAKFAGLSTANKEGAVAESVQAKIDEFNEALKKRPGLQQQTFEAEMLGSGQMGQQRRAAIAQAQQDIKDLDDHLRAVRQEMNMYGQGGKGGRFVGVDVLGSLQSDLDTKRKDLDALQLEEEAAKDNEEKAKARELENQKTIERGRREIPGATAQANLGTATDVVGELRNIAALLQQRQQATPETLGHAYATGDVAGIGVALSNFALFPARMADLVGVIKASNAAFDQALRDVRAQVRSNVNP